MRCWDGDSLKEIHLDVILPFPSLRPVFDKNVQVQIVQDNFVSACGGSAVTLFKLALSSYNVIACVCTMIVSLHLEPIMDLFDLFIDLHAQ